MGRRGATYHVRGKHPAEAFAHVGTPCAVLATNRSWTSFAPLVDPPDGDDLSRALDAPVLMILSDDDAGASLVFSTPDGWSAELPIPLGVEPEPLGPSDRALLAHLVKAGVVPRARADELAAQLARGPRGEWLASDGVETALGVPFAEPLPVPLSEELLGEMGFSAAIVQPAPHPQRTRRSPVTAKAKAQPGAPHEAGAAVDERVLALHVHYWSELFSMNGWKLYNRYKKHLPAERRSEVDQLCDHIWRWETSEVQQAVKRILTAIWTADDWDAAIRDPEIVEAESLDASRLADWQRRLAIP